MGVAANDQVLRGKQFHDVGGVDAHHRPNVLDANYPILCLISAAAARAKVTQRMSLVATPSRIRFAICR